MPKIQLALDRLTIEECIRISQEAGPYVDMIEVGTGVIKEYGMSVVQEIRKRFPDKLIVADMKTCDAGKFEAVQAFEAGAHITTVMGFAGDRTIQDMLAVAEEYGCRLMVDLLGITDVSRVRELHEIGVRLFNIHIGIDSQQDQKWSSDYFRMLEGFDDIEIAVSGGISKQVIPFLLQQSPDVLIVGSAITSQADAGSAAQELKMEVLSIAENH